MGAHLETLANQTVNQTVNQTIIIDGRKAMIDQVSLFRPSDKAGGSRFSPDKIE